MILKVRYQKFTRRSWFLAASSPVDTHSDDSSRTNFTELNSSSISLIDIRPTAPPPRAERIDCHSADNKQPTAVRLNNFFPCTHFQARPPRAEHNDCHSADNKQPTAVKVDNFFPRRHFQVRGGQH